MFGVRGPMGKRVPLPLVVDVDGALLRRELCRSIVHRALRRWPLMARRHWHRQRSDLTARTLADALPDASVPVELNRDILSQIATYQRLGGSIYLMGQAQAPMLASLGTYLGLDAQVLGSEEGIRLDRARQGYILPALFGSKGFVLLGGRRTPPALCLAARECWIIGGTDSRKRRLRTHGGQMTILPHPLWLPLALPMSQISGQGAAHLGPSVGRLASRAAWMRETELIRPAFDMPEPSAEPATTQGRRRA